MARWEKFPESYGVYNAVLQHPSHVGCLPACGYTTLYYVLVKLLSEDRARQTLDHFVRKLRLLPFDVETARLAQRLNFEDLEDAAIAATAMQGQCDRIVTRNVKDFSSSPIRAVSPAQLIGSL